MTIRTPMFFTLAVILMAACNEPVGPVSAVIAGPRVALSVSVDPTGFGFVGKGDVQLAFGWNNATLQNNAGGVTFSLSTTTSYTSVCSWVTGEGTRGERSHEVSHTVTQGLTAVLNGSARQTKGQTQFTGFNLLGFNGDPIQSGGAIPVEGQPCPGNPGTGGTWGPVTTGASTGGLYVTWNGTSLPLSIS